MALMDEGTPQNSSLFTVASDGTEPVGMETAGAGEIAAESVVKWADELGVTRTLARHLLRSGWTEPEAARAYLNPRLSSLTAPDAMADRKQIAQRLARAVRANERICVFGDYDCDGITSAAILTEVLRALGGQVTTHLASRFEGGYGLSSAAAEEIAACRPAVLVTCDCGSSDHETLQILADQGVDNLVIDHHLVPDRPLPALAFLNPHRRECGFPYKGLASCGLVLSVAAQLRKELGVSLNLKRWLDLVAIGTIADVAPLDGDNRALVRAGLAALQDGQRPGVKALLNRAKWQSGAFLTAEDVAFRLAPRLNAPGRLGSPRLALEVLLATTEGEAEGLASQIEQLQLERRGQQDRMLEEADAEIQAEGWSDAPGLVIGRDGWNHGIVGIVAGRLAERWQRPVIVIGFTDGLGRGSARGPKGVRLVELLGQSQDALIRFGGHHAAAGLEVKLTELLAFRNAFATACSRAEPAAGESSSDSATLRLDSHDDLLRIARDFQRLEPCGEANPAPKVAIAGKLVRGQAVRGGHLKVLAMLPSGVEISGFAPNQGDVAGRLKAYVELEGRLTINYWNGGQSAEVRLQGLASGEDSSNLSRHF